MAKVVQSQLDSSGYVSMKFRGLRTKGVLGPGYTYSTALWSVHLKVPVWESKSQQVAILWTKGDLRVWDCEDQSDQ